MVNFVLQLCFNEDYKTYEDHHIYKWGKLTYFLNRKPFLLHWDQANYTGINSRNTIVSIIILSVKTLSKSTRSPDICCLVMISVKNVSSTPIPAIPWALFLASPDGNNSQSAWMGMGEPVAGPGTACDDSIK